jgi:hypothetical protein
MQFPYITKIYIQNEERIPQTVDKFIQSRERQGNGIPCCNRPVL